jgi:broad specificity phosphatase PhoE
MIYHFPRPPHLILSRLSTFPLLILLLTAPSDAAMPAGGGGGGASRRSGSGAARPLILRLHMVRHGETEANKANFVLGQRESPLTEKGISQAAALGTFGRRRRQSFWRAYTSDYDRTLKTARLILGSADDEEEREVEASCSNDVGDGRSQKQGARSYNRDAYGAGEDSSSSEAATMTATSISSSVGSDQSESPVAVPSVIQDKRLRERAKGVREGRPKTVTYDEAVKLHQLENGPDAPLPLLESDDDVWSRVKDWIDEVAAEACNIAAQDEDMQKSATSITDSKGNEYERSTALMDREMLGSVVDPRNQKVQRKDVLVVSHSATIRTAVNRLVGDQLPSNIVRGSGGDDGAAKGMLIVPNTSRTIVDIAVTPGTDVGSAPKWSATLIDLTNTDHLKEM